MPADPPKLVQRGDVDRAGGMRTLPEESPLLVGVFLLMMGLGLLQTLLGVRASLEGVSTTVIGLLMSAYYGGFLAGSLWAPRVVAQVGHIRAFATLASVSSVAFLLHGVFHAPIAWAVMRLVGGLCIAGSMVVAESWLNSRATNETRGRLLSVYMVVVFLGLGSGQLLLAVDDPARIGLFVLVSVLVSMAVVPVSISRHQAPSVSDALPMSTRQVAAAAPVAVLTTLMSGVGHSGLITIGAVYAASIGLSVSQTAVLMAAALGGAIVSLIPVGRLSDRFDRRRMIVATSGLAGAAAAAAALLAGPRTPGLLILLVGALGASTFPLYPLAVTHLNDRLEAEERVAAGAKLVLLYGIGASVGPMSVSVLMATFAPEAFLWHQAAIHGAVLVYVLYRLTRWAPAETKSTYAPYPSGMTPVLVSLSPEQVVSDQPERGTTVSTRGARLRVRERGAGEPVVLIHGYASSSRTWQHQLRALARTGYRAIAYDLRGHGESSPGDGYTLRHHVDDLEDLFDAVERRPVHLVGLGTGAAIAVTYTDRHPEMVRSLTLASCVRWIIPSALLGRMGDRVAPAAEAALTVVIGRRGAPTFARRFYDPAHHPDRYQLVAEDAGRARRVALRGTLGCVAQRDFAEDLPAPTMIVQGERDRATTPGSIRRLHRLMPSARIEILPDAAHFVGLDDPHGFNAALRDFFPEARVATPKAPQHP